MADEFWQGLFNKKIQSEQNWELSRQQHPECRENGKSVQVTVNLRAQTEFGTKAEEIRAKLRVTRDILSVKEEFRGKASQSLTTKLQINLNYALELRYFWTILQCKFNVYTQLYYSNFPIL